MSDSVRPILVSLHAVDQYRRRRGDRRHFHLVQEEIETEIRLALESGRIANHKIDGFGLYGHKRRPLPPQERFVWTEDGQMGWIIRRSDSDDTVVTTLTRTGQQKRVSL